MIQNLEFFFYFSMCIFSYLKIISYLVLQKSITVPVSLFSLLSILYSFYVTNCVWNEYPQQRGTAATSPARPDTLPAFLQGVYTRKLQVLALAELRWNGEKTVQLNQNQKISWNLRRSFGLAVKIQCSLNCVWFILN